jgi:L-histidine Nalpha-methyltransferase
VSTRDQTVAIGQLGTSVPFTAGEALLTEYSYKYSASEIEALAAAADLRLGAQWHDGARRFSVNLFAPAEAPRNGTTAAEGAAGSRSP